MPELVLTARVSLAEFLSAGETSRHAIAPRHDEDISTSGLPKRTATALGQPARLIRVPAAALLTIARALNGSDFVQWLCDSLHPDISNSRRLLACASAVRPTNAPADAARQSLVQARS